MQGKCTIDILIVYPYESSIEQLLIIYMSIQTYLQYIVTSDIAIIACLLLTYTQLATSFTCKSNLSMHVVIVIYLHMNMQTFLKYCTKKNMILYYKDKTLSRNIVSSESVLL